VLNYCVPTYLPHPVKVPWIRAATPESIWLRPEVVERLCKILPWHKALAVRFAILSLLREDAMLSIQWPHVHIKERWCEVKAIVQKNGQPFGIALTDDHIEVLRALRAFQRVQWEDHVRRCKRKKLQPRATWDNLHVFTWKGHKIDQCNTAAYRRALEQAGAPEGANWHSLRHTGAMYARFGKTSIADLMAAGAWRSVASMVPYMHVDPDLLLPVSRTVASKLPRLTIPSHVLLANEDELTDESLQKQAFGLVGRVGLEPTTNALKGLDPTPAGYIPTKENKQLAEALERATGREWQQKAANGR